MEISDVVIIGFVTLPENFVAHDLVPRGMINRFIENQLNGVNDVFIESFKIKILQFLSVFLNGSLNVFCKILL